MLSLFIIIIIIMALQNFNISLDVYGNLYFSHNKTNITYQLNIDGKNKITLDKDNYKIIEQYTKINKIKYLDENSLKNKMKNNNLEQDGSEGSEGSDEITDHIYYPEDEGYVIDSVLDNQDPDQEVIDEDFINKYGENNLQFTFWQPDDSGINIYCREDEDIMALYDTYIYDINNRLLFKSNSPDNSSIYRLRIFPTGEIFFRPIGYSEQKYILKIPEYDESEIKLELC